MFADASDTGAGAVLSVDGPEAASSSVIQALRRVAPEGMSQDELVERARRGIEYMTAFPALVRDDSSTLRELWGVLAFAMAGSSLLAGGHRRVVMDNLGRVFITGGLVPPFAVGGKRLSELVSGGSPNPRCRPWRSHLSTPKSTADSCSLSSGCRASRTCGRTISHTSRQCGIPATACERNCSTRSMSGGARIRSTVSPRLTTASRSRPRTRAVSAPPGGGVDGHVHRVLRRG